MALDATEVQALARGIQKLLPPGRAFRVQPGSKFQSLLEGLAVEPCRVQGRGRDLIREADPYRTVELLVDWENTAGLPNLCIGEPETQTLRRAALVAKLREQGGASVPFLVEIAEDVLGYTNVTITEYQAAQVGLFKVGDKLTNGPWLFAFTVGADEIRPDFFTAEESAAGEPLTAASNQIVECLLGWDGLAPGHSVPLFTFSNFYQGYAPWQPVEFTPTRAALTFAPQSPTIDTA